MKRVVNTLLQKWAGRPGGAPPAAAGLPGLFVGDGDIAGLVVIAGAEGQAVVGPIGESVHGGLFIPKRFDGGFNVGAAVVPVLILEHHISLSLPNGVLNAGHILVHGQHRRIQIADRQGVDPRVRVRPAGGDLIVHAADEAAGGGVAAGLCRSGRSAGVIASPLSVGIAAGLELDPVFAVVEGRVDLVKVALLLRRGPLFVGEGNRPAGFGAEVVVGDVPGAAVGVAVKAVPGGTHVLAGQLDGAVGVAGEGDGLALAVHLRDGLLQKRLDLHRGGRVLGVLLGLLLLLLLPLRVLAALDLLRHIGAAQLIAHIGAVKGHYRIVRVPLCNGLTDLPAVLGQKGGIDAGAGEIDVGGPGGKKLVLCCRLELRLGLIGESLDGGKAEGEDLVELLLLLLLFLLLLLLVGVGQVRVVVLGAGADAVGRPSGVAVGAHIVVALEEVVVADIAGPVGDGVVPGGVYMVPRPVDLHHVPGVAAIGVAGDILAGDARLLHQKLIGPGVAGADGGALQQRAIRSVGLRRNGVTEIVVVIVDAVEHQIVVEGLGDVIVAHAGGDRLRQDGVRRLHGGPGCPAVGGGAADVVDGQAQGLAAQVHGAGDALHLIGVVPRDVRQRLRQLSGLVQAQIIVCQLYVAVAVDEGVHNVRRQSLVADQGQLALRGQFLFLLRAAGKLPPQAVGHVPPGAAGLGREGQPLGEAAVRRPGHGLVRPVRAARVPAGLAAHEGHHLVIGQGGVEVEAVAPHAVDQALLHRPEDGVVIIGVPVGDVGEGGDGGGWLRPALGPPQEGDGLRPGDGIVRGEAPAAGALHDPLVHRPGHRVGIVIGGLHVAEAPEGGQRPRRKQQRQHQRQQGGKRSSFHAQAPLIFDLIPAPRADGARPPISPGQKTAALSWRNAIKAPYAPL